MWFGQMNIHELFDFCHQLTNSKRMQQTDTKATKMSRKKDLLKKQDAVLTAIVLVTRSIYESNEKLIAQNKEYRKRLGIRAFPRSRAAQKESDIKFSQQMDKILEEKFGSKKKAIK